MFQRQIQGRLEIYKSPLLLNQRGLVHGFSSRAGGFSSGVYSSLNLGLTSGDVLMDVRQNRMLFATTLGWAGTGWCAGGRYTALILLKLEKPRRDRDFWTQHRHCRILMVW